MWMMQNDFKRKGLPQLSLSLQSSQFVCSPFQELQILMMEGLHFCCLCSPCSQLHEWLSSFYSSLRLCYFWFIDNKSNFNPVMENLSSVTTVSVGYKIPIEIIKRMFFEHSENSNIIDSLNWTNELFIFYSKV